MCSLAASHARASRARIDFGVDFGTFRKQIHEIHEINGFVTLLSSRQPVYSIGDISGDITDRIILGTAGGAARCRMLLLFGLHKIGSAAPTAKHLYEVCTHDPLNPETTHCIDSSPRVLRLLSA